MKEKNIQLSEGSGGRDMTDLITHIRSVLGSPESWSESDNDASIFDIGAGKVIAFTTDSFVVDPVFFPGGNIGHIAACGTINDIAVMGAAPIGLSLALIIEEGFPRSDLDMILNSVNEVCLKARVDVATGDTKVMEQGKLDKIVITTAAVGICRKEDILNKAILPGDRIIISGSVADHAAALLSKRFDIRTSLLTDAKALVDEMRSISALIKIAKDPTRGGISSVLNEICLKHKIGMLINDENIPIRHEARAIFRMLGLDPHQLACEGRIVCVCSAGASDEVVRRLKCFNKDACLIGEVTEGNKVVVNTRFGQRIMSLPSGRIVPRIC